jgi:hypothetical protein
MTAKTARPPEQLAPHRVVRYAKHRLMILGQRNRDRKLRHPADELLGAVQRVDDPDACTLEPFLVVLALFGEPSIAWKRFAQNRSDRTVGLQVGRRHGIVAAF